MILVFLLNGCLLLGALSDFRDFIMALLREQFICITFASNQEILHRKFRIRDLGYKPQTQQQTSQFKSPSSAHPKKIRQVRSKIKSLLVIFFDCEVIFHQECVPIGQVVSWHYDHDILQG